MSVSGKDILWLGAHKTGTTFLQKSLSQSLPGLVANGLHYAPLEPFRNEVTRPLLYSGYDKAPVAQSQPVGCRRIVFDENILALVQDALRPWGVYPDGAERALKVAQFLELERPVIVLGIRNFAQFLPALYCEALKSTPFQPFLQFVKTPLNNLSWVPLVENLCHGFPESSILIYRAEDLRGNERALLTHLCGCANEDIKLLPDPERHSFSQEAISYLEAIRQTRTVVAHDVREAVNRFPRNHVNKRFVPWSAAEIDLFGQFYQDDLEQIAKFPQVRLWTPPMSRGSETLF